MAVSIDSASTVIAIIGLSISHTLVLYKNDTG